MITASVKLDLKGLEDLKKNLTGYSARVGILGDSAARTDPAHAMGDQLTNSEIAVVQIFGSITQKIPPRDFLLMPLLLKHREITQAMGSSLVKAAVAARDYKRVFLLLGAKAEQYVQMAFETSGFGQWAPNAPRTIAQKGSSRPLIDTGQLRRAVSSDVVVKKGGKE